MTESVDGGAPFETVTKVQAAERQLRIAIRLFFERRDLMAVHTLGAAARQVLQDLGRPRGIKGISEGEFIRAERQKEWVMIFKRAENFFKHADRDADESLKFYYDATPFFLLDAALLHIRLTGRQIPEIQALIVWSALRFPNIVMEGPLKELVTGVAATGLDPDDFGSILKAIDAFN